MNKLHLLALIPLLGFASASAADYTFTELVFPADVTVSDLLMNESGQVVGNYEDPLDQGIKRGFIWKDGVYTEPEPGAQGSYGAVRDLNDDGQVAGSYGYNACFWDGEGRTDLPSLGNVSDASDINADGMIVGALYGANGSRTACLWSGGNEDPIELVPTGSEKSYAAAINDAGDVVGWTYQGDGQNFKLFVWQPGQPYEAPDYLTTPQSALISFKGINESGSVIGDRSEVSPMEKATFWRKGPQGYDYVDLNVVQGILSEAHAINDADIVVGEFRYEDLSQGVLRRACKWQVNDNSVSFSSLAVESNLSVAHDVNSLGDIVGEDGGKPCLWKNGERIDLTSYFPGDNEMIKGGVALHINDAGFIVGTFHKDGYQTHVFLLTPPELDPDPDADPDPDVDPDGDPAQDSPPIVSTKTRPIVKIFGKKKRSTDQRKVRVKGVTFGTAWKVTIKRGGKGCKVVGTTRWRARIKLRPGRNKVVARATGAGGISIPARVTITRK